VWHNCLRFLSVIGHKEDVAVLGASKGGHAWKFAAIAVVENRGCGAGGAAKLLHRSSSAHRANLWALQFHPPSVAAIARRFVARKV
jgi:hypothetical protein